MMKVYVAYLRYSGSVGGKVEPDVQLLIRIWCSIQFSSSWFSVYLNIHGILHISLGLLSAVYPPGFRSKCSSYQWGRAHLQCWISMLLLLLSRFSRVWLCDPIDGSPSGSPVPGILQARTLEWVATSFSNAWKWKWSCSVKSGSSRSHGLQPTRLLHPWDFPGKSTGVGCHCLLLTLWLMTTKRSWIA